MGNGFQKENSNGFQKASRRKRNQEQTTSYTPQSMTSADIAGAFAGYFIMRSEKEEDAEENK